MLASNKRAIKNLQKEAQTARQLTHANIVRIHDLHTDEHQKFLVMEYIDGQTLEDLLADTEDEKLPLETLLPLAEQIARGLDYAHQKGVLHRDLKPSNIMIATDGEVKLLDFGIAREMKDSYTRVTGHETSGTLPYMSPEQLRGKPPSASMDIYSLAAVMYECLCGHAPFFTGDLRHQILNEAAAPLEDIAQSGILLQALAKDPKQRPASARELVRALQSDAGQGKDRETPHGKGQTPETAGAPRPNREAVTQRICLWVANRQAEWTEGEWKDFVISLHDDGCAAGLSQKQLQKIRDQEKKAWLKAEEDRKAEAVRIAEERRRAAEEAERKRQEAEIARKRGEEEQLYEEIRTAATAALCQRYLAQHPDGRYCKQVKKALDRLTKEREQRSSRTKLAVFAVVALVIVFFVVGRVMQNKTETHGSATSVQSREENPRKTPSDALVAKAGAVQGDPWTIPGLNMAFAYVAPGSFQMGSNDGYSDEKPVHTVRISQRYWMGKYEVTQQQYESIMGNNPSNFKGANNPVENVSWNDCVSFCRKLTDQERRAGRLPEGYEYRLPTEAEWEYAARGGSRGRDTKYAGSDSIDSVAWYLSNSAKKTHPVGQKQANELGSMI